MGSQVSPETQEVNGQDRPWAIGLQSPRHHGNVQSTHQNRTETLNDHSLYSPSSAYIDIHHRSIQSAYGNHTLRQVQRSPSVVSAKESLPDRDQSIDVNSAGRDVTSPKDLQARPQLTRASTTFYDRILTDWWWWELFSWLIAFVCVAAILGVLAFYDGKKQPDFIVPGITLNAYVSALAAIAKAALILPVSEAIGQLKWMWYRKEARLWDFATFDGASRGPWGSVMLLGTTRFKHLVSLGALITILALAFEPFFQQIVSFATRDTVAGMSAISVAKTYDPHDDNFYIVDSRYVQHNFVGRSMQLAVSDIMSSINKSVTPAPSICPSGRCNWTTYSSLGVCHSCQDLSSSLEYICQNHTTDIYTVESSRIINPCGYTYNKTFLTGYSWSVGRHVRYLSTFAVGDRQISTTATYNWNSTAFGNITNSIFNFYIGYTPGGLPELLANATPVFKECMLQWCVKSYNAEYNSGSLEEKLVSTVTRPYLPIIPGQNISTDIPFDIDVAGTSYHVAENTTAVLVAAVRSNLPVLLSGVDEGTDGAMPGIWSFLQHSPYDFDPFLARITTAMTNNMRSQAFGTEVIQGQSWTRENFVKIRWVWATLPGLLLFGTLVFVCSTIIKARNHEGAAWKSSALATLLHGLSEETRGRFNAKASQSEIEALSHKLRVRLETKDGGTRLVTV